ncbi:hypothetical protein, partial [Sphingomonas sp. T9W2]|uniref:hypothetical protein n=1 Tax=Sphingomonas sp. T9W2 TaxID=3143183 RepID=UPI0031F556D1
VESDVIVTQADREAFARLDDWEPGSMGWNMIVHPTGPDCVGAVAFAKHRLAAHGRAWFPHKDFAGEPMQEGQFREPYPMAEEWQAMQTKVHAAIVAWCEGGPIHPHRLAGLAGHLTTAIITQEVKR